MTQEAIARALGIDPGTVSRDRRRGMPVDSVEAARAWRAQHIRPRMPRVPLAPPPPPQPSAASAAALALAEHAAGLLARGEDITALVPALRAALHAVPHAERPGLALPLPVFDVLVADVLALVQAAGSEPCEPSEADAEWLGRFWFAAAAGEVRPA